MTLIDRHSSEIIARLLDELTSCSALAHYRIDTVVGAGGFAIIFHAHDTSLQRDVAIKVLRADLAATPEQAARFQREARILNELSHPNIVRVYTAGTTAQGSPYMVMELVRGCPLSDYLEEVATKPVRELAQIFLQLCDALRSLHMHGIIHRDLTVSNILLLPSSPHGYCVKVIDFGLARFELPQSGQQRLTAKGETVGSPAYMSPEQCLGGVLDARSDIYSMGCIMYEVLAGHPPFSMSNTSECMIMHVSSKPDDIINLNDRYREALNQVIQVCLQKHPGDRFQTAEELAEAITKAMEDPVQATKHIRAKYKPQQTGRGKILLMATVAIIVVSLATIALSKLCLRSSQREAQALPDDVETFVGRLSDLAIAGKRSEIIALGEPLLRQHSEQRLSPAKRSELVRTLAESYNAVGDYKRCMELAQQQLPSIDPESDDYSSVTESYLHSAKSLGKIEEALPFATGCLARMEESENHSLKLVNGELYEELAACYSSVGDKAAAKRILERANRLIEDDPDQNHRMLTYLHLAFAYRALDDAGQTRRFINALTKIIQDSELSAPELRYAATRAAELGSWKTPELVIAFNKRATRYLSSASRSESGSDDNTGLCAAMVQLNDPVQQPDQRLFWLEQSARYSHDGIGEFALYTALAQVKHLMKNDQGAAESLRQASHYVSQLKLDDGRSNVSEELHCYSSLRADVATKTRNEQAIRQELEKQLSAGTIGDAERTADIDTLLQLEIANGNDLLKNTKDVQNGLTQLDKAASLAAKIAIYDDTAHKFSDLSRDFLLDRITLSNQDTISACEKLAEHLLAAANTKTESLPSARLRLAAEQMYIACGNKIVPQQIMQSLFDITTRLKAWTEPSWVFDMDMPIDIYSRKAFVHPVPGFEPQELLAYQRKSSTTEARLNELFLLTGWDRALMRKASFADDCRNLAAFCREYPKMHAIFKEQAFLQCSDTSFHYNDVKAGLEYSEQAQRMAPSPGDLCGVYYQLAWRYAERNNHEQACAIWRKAFDISRSNKSIVLLDGYFTVYENELRKLHRDGEAEIVERYKKELSAEGRVVF